MIIHSLEFQFQDELLFRASEDEPIPVPGKNEQIEHDGICYRVSNVVHRYVHKLECTYAYTLTINTDIILELNE